MMTRQEAVEIARKHARANPESYYQEPFEPHEWVIQAILDAYDRGEYHGQRMMEPPMWGSW